MIDATALCSRSMAVTSLSLESFMPAVRLRTMALACSIWSLKNSPKFFIYILHLLASTTVVKPLRAASSASTSRTARITSDSLPTPEGSIRMRSG